MKFEGDRAFRGPHRKIWLTRRWLAQSAARVLLALGRVLVNAGIGRMSALGRTGPAGMAGMTQTGPKPDQDFALRLAPD